MMRNSLWCVAGMLLLLGAPSVAQAQQDPDAIRQLSDAQVKQLTEEAAAKFAQAKQLDAQAAQARAAGNTTLANQLTAQADQLRQQGHALYDQAQQRQAQTEGLIGRMNETTARIDAMDKAYDKPGFWDKVGDKAIDIIGDLLSQLIQQWIAGGGQDDDLLNRINELQDERDRLLNERDTSGGGGTDGLGNIITDPNGTYGYDRDNDGFVDIPLNPDGTPAGPYDPTNPDAYGNNGGLAGGLDGLNGLDGSGGSDGLDGLAGLPGFSGGGGLGGGSGSGPGLGGFGSGGIGGNTGGEGLPGGDELGGGMGPAKAAGGAGGAEDGTSTAGKIDRDGDGKPDDDDRDVETVMGRIVVLPKLEFEEVAGDHQEGGDWSNDFEEWGDDDWDDKKDNGDFSEEDWGQPAKDKKKSKGGKGTVGDAEEAAKLVDELIRVETVIQEWRKVEEAEESGEKDPYFQDDEMSGYRASGDKAPTEEDPFKDVRDEEGKIDVTKVDVWVIERDTWKTGKTPTRYKVNAPLDLKGFDPIHGGVLVARGVVKELDVDEGVLKRIKGDVKQVELVSVILSAEKPPEDMDALDPSKTKDSDVGGLDESEKESEGFDDGSDW